MKVLINELPVNPKFNAQLTMSVQEYLNLIRVLSVVRNKANSISDDKLFVSFIKETVEVVLENVTDGTDAHLCHLIKLETKDLTELQ